MRELKRYEEEEAMPVLTQFEKIAMRKGRREGLKEGQAEILAHQLERKFGRLDETTRERVQSARPGDILGWADRVLTAERLEDVFA